MKKNYKKHCIGRLSNQVKEDPIIFESFRLAFNYANKMGLEGKEVKNVFIENSPETDLTDFRGMKILGCYIECSEERKN
jgi:hypothetical protein